MMFRDNMKLITVGKGIQRMLLPDPDERLFTAVEKYTLNSKQSLRLIKKLTRFLNKNNIPGDFVECGTYKGGSAAIIASELNPSRHLWLYDSFQGLPTPKSEDGLYAQNFSGSLVSSPDDVKKIFQTLNIPETYYTIREGWFQQTFQEPLPGKVAFLHCDADWYESVSLVLNTFYPKIPEGGCILLDDFGYWEGCREAFYDFCGKTGEKPLVERVGISQAFWFKGRRHNRTNHGEWYNAL
jgi:O-methyltransferase